MNHIPTVATLKINKIDGGGTESRHRERSEHFTKSRQSVKNSESQDNSTWTQETKYENEEN